MKISVGDRLPEATLIQVGENGPEPVQLAERLQGRKVVLFAVPGAFTPTCHSAHVPSFIRTKAELEARGVDDVICLSVNDPFVMQAWAKATGADAAGITMLADADASFTNAIGAAFDAAPAGLLNRSVRYALLAEDGVVQVLHLETARGTCEVSGGESMLAAL